MSALAYGDLDARGEAERRNGLRQVPRGQDPETVGYWSTCLGKAVWIRNDLRQAIPRRREDLSFPTFTFTLKTTKPLPDGAVWIDETAGRYELPGGRFGYVDVPDVKGQEKFMRGLEKLERASERAAKRAAPKIQPAKVATVRVQAGRVLEVVGLPRGYSFTVEEVGA